jgi:Laminin G domain.
VLPFHRNFGDTELKIGRVEIEGSVNKSALSVETHSAEIPSPILNLGADSDVFVGGVPEGKSIPSALASRVFSGCMQNLMYDSQLKGLWNWKVCLI